MSAQARSIAPSPPRPAATTPPVAAPARVLAADATVDFTLVTERQAFDALEAEWNDLFERAGRPAQVFQSFNWNWHWANHYVAGAPGGKECLKLSLVIGRRDGKLIMIWPLATERVRGITQIFWMGEPVSQYGDVIIDTIPDTEDVLRAGWKFLAANARGDIVRLRRVRAGSVVAPLLIEIGARIADRQTAPYIDLASAPSFAAYEERYSNHARKNRRRLRRRLEERGPVEYERHYGGPQARALAVKALELKGEWLRHRGLISNAITDQRMSRFFADAAGGEAKSTNCIVSVLKSNGEPAALEVDFTCKGRLSMHVIVYNLKFEKAGAGALLMELCLADGYKDGLGVYDMLAPGDTYKLDWADGSEDVCDWVKPLNVTGYTYARLYLGLLRGRAKAAISALPPGVRKLLSNGYASGHSS